MTNKTLKWGEILTLSRNELIKALQELFKKIDNWDDTQILNATTQIQLALFNTNLNHTSRFSDIDSSIINKIAMIIYDYYKQWFATQRLESILDLNNGLSGLFETTKKIIGKDNNNVDRKFKESLSTSNKNTDERDNRIDTNNITASKDINENRNAVMDSASNITDEPIDEIRKAKYLSGGALGKEVNRSTGSSNGITLNTQQGSNTNEGSSNREVELDNIKRERNYDRTITDQSLKVQYLKQLQDATMLIQHGLRDFIGNVFYNILLPIQEVSITNLPWPWEY